MSSKSFSKFCLKVCIGIAGLGIATSFTPILNNPVKAGLGSVPDCPDEGSAAASGAMSEDCYLTPETMEVKFYELGFCTTSDPLSGANFSRTNCTKAWESSSGQTLDLASFTRSSPGSQMLGKPASLTKLEVKPISLACS